MRKAFNLTALSKKFGEGYVARIDGTNRIVGYVPTADVLMKKIQYKKEFKENKVVISWIPKYNATYVFGVSLSLRGS